MKKSIRYIFMLGLLLSLVLPLPLTAQEEPEVISLGDEVSGTLQAGKTVIYDLSVEDINEGFDIVLVSPMDSMMSVYADLGQMIHIVNLMGDYGFEVYTWEPEDIKPAQIKVSFYRRDLTGDYSVSILPAEKHISEDPEPGEQVKRWDDVEVGEAGKTQTVTVPYLLYVPEDYDESKLYPFMLFMHGYGETGNRLDFLKRQVIPKLIEEGEDFPFIIASPQVTYGKDWRVQTDVLGSFVAYLQSEFPIDPDRIYITGLSMGGSGAWHFALAYPDLPAAVAPLAGYYTYGAVRVPENICDLAQTPLWVFHGGQDEVVPLAWDQALVDAVKECGGDIKFTLYPDADHGQTFVQGYTDPALYEWLLEHHK